MSLLRVAHPLLLVPIQYDAPEVESEAPNDEKINVYQFGGHIYSLITGLRVYQEDYVGDARVSYVRL